MPLIWPYDAMNALTPMTIMCTNVDPDVGGHINVTQLEFAWEPQLWITHPVIGGPARVWFDVSNVEGRPFLDGGIMYSVYGNNDDPFDKCTGGGCAPGQESCDGVYDYPADDVVSTSDLPLRQTCSSWWLYRGVERGLIRSRRR